MDEKDVKESIKASGKGLRRKKAGVQKRAKAPNHSHKIAALRRESGILLNDILRTSVEG
jgi:hypothetical protein